MSAKILKADFGRNAQNRNPDSFSFVKGKSDIVTQIANYHSEFRNRQDFISSVTSKPHRFVIFSYTRYYGIEPIARCSLERAQKLIDDIKSGSEEVFLAATRLEDCFDTQWPENRVQDSLDDLINRPVDLRFKEARDVVLSFKNIEP